MHSLSAPLCDRHLACHPPASGEEWQENSHRGLELEGGRGARGGGRRVRGRSSIPGRCTCARAVEHRHTRAGARAHTPKKSSVTCSLSKPALAPGKTYPFPVSTPTSGSSSPRRHPYNFPNYVQKEKCTLGTIYIYNMYLYLRLPLVRPFCTHTSLALPLSAHTSLPPPPAVQA